MTVRLKLDRLSASDEAATFADAVRRADNLEFGREGYTASGGVKEAGPSRTLGATRFTASGDSKQVAGSRPSLAGEDFTASGDGKVPPPENFR